MAEGSVWADPEKSRQAVQEIKELKRWVDPYHAVRKRIDDARALLELGEGESDEEHGRLVAEMLKGRTSTRRDRKSTRLNSSHSQISYAVFCLKKKNKS